MRVRICFVFFLLLTAIASSCGHTCDNQRLQVRQSVVDRFGEFRQLKTLIEKHSKVILDSCRYQTIAQQDVDTSEVSVAVWMNTDKLKQWLPDATPAERNLINTIAPMLKDGAAIHYNPKTGGFQFDLPYATCGDTVFTHILGFSRIAGADRDPALRLNKELGEGWAYFINSYVDHEPAVPPEAGEAGQ